MTPLLQFKQAGFEKLSPLSSSLMAGERKVLILPNKDLKHVVSDLILGELLPEQGEVIVNGVPAAQVAAGTAGVIQANGGMISNLKVWENITLPKWYHAGRQRRKMEEVVAKWLRLFMPDEADWVGFMASPVGKLRNSERKLAGIMRMLVTAPDLLVLDAALFDDVDESKATRWREVLEQYQEENPERALLALCHQSSRLPWSRMEYQHEITG